MEGLCPNAPPGESEAGSPPFNRPVQGESSPTHRHGCEYRDTGHICPFLQTPQPHISCLQRISFIFPLTRSNKFGYHIRHC